MFTSSPEWGNSFLSLHLVYYSKNNQSPMPFIKPSPYIGSPPMYLCIGSLPLLEMAHLFPAPRGLCTRRRGQHPPARHRSWCWHPECLQLPGQTSRAILMWMHKKELLSRQNTETQNTETTYSPLRKKWHSSLRLIGNRRDNRKTACVHFVSLGRKVKWLIKCPTNRRRWCIYKIPCLCCAACHSAAQDQERAGAISP